MITITHDILRRPKGIVRLWEEMPSPGARRRPLPGQGEVLRRRRGKLLFEADNLYVNAGLPVLANLLAAGTAGYVAAAVGFGSGNTAPTVGDTDLSLAPKYYNAVGSAVIGPSGGVASGSVLFNYGLATSDYAANPLTIQELGLYANTVPHHVPALVGSLHSAWTASNTYGVGNLIIDSNGDVQRCTTAGTSGGSAPSWAITIGNTTTDNTVTWTCITNNTAPGPMIAHVVVPSFPYTGGGNYSGTWTISM